MDPSAYTFDSLEDAGCVLCRCRSGTRAIPRLPFRCLDERGHGCVLGSVGRRVALARCRAIATEVLS